MWKLVCLLSLFVFVSTPVLAQKKIEACILSTASNGQVLTIHGKVVNTPHDLAFEIVGRARS